MKLSQDAMQLHIDMLNDRTRTTGFLRAIDATVRPHDVVIDIGTGTGILAIAAARAGARHVYAIEAGQQISNIASAMIKANGLEDRITLIKGWSTKVDLPERADMLVSEVIGHDPLAESVLETMVDAVQRLLKPGARLIPRKLKIFCLPVAVPEAELKKLIFTSAAAGNWQRWYGIKFDPLLDVNRDLLFRFLLNPYRLRRWRTLSPPILLEEIDFLRCTNAQIDSTGTGKATSAGQMNGLLFFFELVLTEDLILSSHPARVQKHHHWSSPVWVFVDPLPLHPKTRFSINYRYDPAKHYTRCNVSLID